jgi:Peptidase S46
MKRTTLVLALIGLFAAATIADEGMWTFDNFPKADVMKKYGVQVTDQMLDRLQHAVVRLESGCTGSFVSPDGLVLSNHHCARACLAENSTAQRDLLGNGFTAKTREEEIRCQGQQVSVLMKTENVTAKVTGALAGAAAADVSRRRNETLTNLESAARRNQRKRARRSSARR